MPQYDYRCRDGHVHEVEAHMGKAPKTTTCTCGKRAVRVYAMPNVSWNKWNPNYSFNDISDEIDGERDAIACGAYE